jgi:chromosomal replication initiator protein
MIDYFKSYDYNIAESSDINIRRLTASIQFNKSNLKKIDAIKLIKLNKTTLNRIQYEVSNYMGLTKSEMLDNSRERRKVQARQLCFYFSRKLTKYSLNEISKYTGKKNHATCIFGIRQIENLIFSDKEFKKMVEQIEKLIIPYENR